MIGSLDRPVLGQALLVAAASDMVPLEKPLINLHRSAYKTNVRFVLGSSGMLANQIRNGAPYDVYLSANLEFVRDLSESGHLAPDSVRVYAVGRVALWSKSGEVGRLEDLLKPGLAHVAIANPVHAPYGAAAQQALQRAGLWARLQDKIVLGENVRQALQYAESGNAEAAIVAWSLVIHRGGILLPEMLHEPIRQAGGVVTRSARGAEGRRFLDMLGSGAGAALLKKFGFAPARPGP